MRRSRVPSNGPGRFFASQFSAGCTTNLPGFDFDRHRQVCLTPDSVAKVFLQHGPQILRAGGAAIE
jgi:hypothetical protein